VDRVYALQVPLRIQPGLVFMAYQVRPPSGTVVDSSEQSGGAVALVCGQGHFPRPVEEGVIGLRAGGEKLIPIAPVTLPATIIRERSAASSWRG